MTSSWRGSSGGVGVAGSSGNRGFLGAGAASIHESDTWSGAVG
eukprot:CAMPEP_0180793886 /NCGR_PEP_ID=MMETSP1038_2-20121128/55275_1 /TAXON_ID=632150 /ORGANISM="Azadinium spinosum, Strain 3D9" /LENGTH=42 /DNA_ID= /DNA_START= /DNA_END= /DNA_ORIENTATION=